MPSASIWQGHKRNAGALAKTVWNVERRFKQTPSITNSLTADQHQGPLTYLMGMAYYEKVNRFVPLNAQLHGRSPISTIAIGCANHCREELGHIHRLAALES